MSAGTDVSQGSVVAYYAGVPDTTVLHIDLSVDTGIRVEARGL